MFAWTRKRAYKRNLDNMNYLEEFPNIELDDLTDNSVVEELSGNGSTDLSVKIGISSRDF